MSKPFYITTAIAYVNAAPHMGHAMEFIETDAIARYKRNQGFDVRFLTGADEHGVKIYNTAKEAGEETQPFVDRHAKTFMDLKPLLYLSNDDFIRTSDQQRHWPACQALWKKLVEKGDIYEKEYEGLYCSGCETFLQERDLVEGNCTVHKRAPELVQEKNYFFRLSKYSDQIVKLIETGEVEIVPDTRKNEFLNVAKEGLHDVSFSRPKNVLPWGIPVPGDDSQVMYVWCDALTNYISALGYGAEDELFQKYWPADLHVIGKDIVRFHAGIWIGMLLSAEIPIQKGILIHGFLTYNGEKMSKSTGNVVDPVEIAQKYGADALRYYLLREIPVGRDGDFSDKLFVERYNADLANNLGNLVNRVHTLVERNKQGAFDFKRNSGAYIEKVEETWAKYTKEMDAYNLHEAVFHVWRLVDFANKRMEEEKPWSAVKENPTEGWATLSNLLETIRHITMMIDPFIPAAAAEIRQQIGLPVEFSIEKEGKWATQMRWDNLGERAIIFPRIEEGEAA